MKDFLAVDIGNYSCQSCVISASGTTPIRTIRSLLYDCTFESDIRNNAYNDENLLITIGDKSYLVGKRAESYASHKSAAEAGKSRSDVVLPLVLSALKHDFYGEIKFLVPSRNEVQESFLRNALVKSHSFCRNGISLSAEFTGITFYEETKAAARYAFESKIVPKSSVLFVADIGGGTVNYGVFQYEDGNFVCKEYKPNNNLGGIELAKAIAATDVVKRFRWTPNISRILTSISNGSLVIGNRQELDFSPVYEMCVDRWFGALLVRAKSDMNAFFPDVTDAIWVGGGAEIVRSRIEKTPHRVLDNPQRANIMHLVHQAQIELGGEASSNVSIPALVAR